MFGAIVLYVKQLNGLRIMNIYKSDFVAKT